VSSAKLSFKIAARRKIGTSMLHLAAYTLML